MKSQSDPKLMHHEGQHEDIINFLLKLEPEKLSEVCSKDPSLVEICGDRNFIKRYFEHHKDEIKRRLQRQQNARQSLKLPKQEFVPRHKQREFHGLKSPAKSPKGKSFILPPEIAPEGYKVVRKWHWGYETWANDIQYEGHHRGEVPHFNIQKKGCRPNSISRISYWRRRFQICCNGCWWQRNLFLLKLFGKIFLKCFLTLVKKDSFAWQAF